MAGERVTKQRLVYAILKFIEREIQAESANAERRETMEVAAQCLETAFEVSLANTNNDTVFGPPLDLLAIASEFDGSDLATATFEETTTFSSWLGEAEPQARQVPLTDDMRQQADKLKNEGNEFMKQEKYKEALESYNAAIKIDGHNAIYYCNRAAAHNKMNNNEQALQDCFRSIEIDPNYSKAYGRLGVIYLSLEKVNEALEAYKKASSLEPQNENYKQSIRICEDRLGAGHGAGAMGGMPNLPPMFSSLLGGLGAGATGAGPGAPGGMPDMMSLFNNPSLMNMAMQFVQNPQVQGLMANLVSNLGNQDGGEVGIETLLQTGQRMASELSQNNPDLIESLRRNMPRPPGTDPSNPAGSSNQPKPGDSDQNKPGSS